MNQSCNNDNAWKLFLVDVMYGDSECGSTKKCLLNGCYNEKEITIFHPTAVIEFEVRGGTHSVTYPSPSWLEVIVYS